MAGPSGAALELVNSPLLNEILDGFERDAIDAAINAHPSDDETRRVATTEARAIQSLRGKLLSLSKGTTKPPKRGSVA